MYEQKEHCEKCSIRKSGNVIRYLKTSIFSSFDIFFFSYSFTSSSLSLAPFSSCSFECAMERKSQRTESINKRNTMKKRELVLNRWHSLSFIHISIHMMMYTTNSWVLIFFFFLLLCYSLLILFIIIFNIIICSCFKMSRYMFIFDHDRV